MVISILDNNSDRTFKEHSSVGRTSVSKTGCQGFKSSCSCILRILMIVHKLAKKTLERSKHMSTVLIVDDASIMRMVMKDILQRYCKYEKHKIHEASDGHDAILKYGKVKPSVVLCDISMPGMNGIDVVKAIIEKDSEAKIIMITASNDEADVVECIRAGAKDYIIKPPKPERVVMAIKRITDDNPLTQQEQEREHDENTSDSDGNSKSEENQDSADGENSEKKPDEFTEQVKELRVQLETES